ncbi:AAA family ATPase [Candidatus Dojkabacteria bacterium]|nr:AAA family ATPase [Candidatus Dojkabacteria bacterium]
MLQSKYLSLLKQIQNDPGQNEAIERNDDKHCIVIAGPGTGKTRTLVLKATKLLNETIHPPQGLACVTYAHSMAEELRQRLFELGVYKRRNVFIGTLHGFSLSNILVPFGRLYNYPLPNPLKVASDKQQAEIYREIWNALNFSNSIPSFEPERDRIDNSFADRLPIMFQKYRRTQLDGLQSPGANQHVEELLEIYETTLLSHGFTDFDLQIKWAMKLVEDEAYVRDSLAAKYPWFLIDEYQDLGLPLHRMVLSLTANTNMKLFAIGDPNQCIYDFSGASPAYLRELEMSNERYGELLCFRWKWNFAPLKLVT